MILSLVEAPCFWVGLRWWFEHAEIFISVLKFSLSVYSSQAIARAFSWLAPEHFWHQSEPLLDCQAPGRSSPYGHPCPKFLKNQDDYYGEM